MLILIQSLWRFKTVSNILLMTLLFASQAADLLAWTKPVHLPYSQMGWGSMDLASSGFFFCHWEVMLNSFEDWEEDYVPAGREKALVLSLSIFLLIFVTCQNTNVPLMPTSFCFGFEWTYFIWCPEYRWCHSSLKWPLEFMEPVEYVVTSISKFCNSFCVCKLCC